MASQAAVAWGQVGLAGREAGTGAKNERKEWQVPRVNGG